MPKETILMTENQWANSQFSIARSLRRRKDQREGLYDM